MPSEAFRTGDLSALLNRTSATGAPLPAIQVIDPQTGAPFPGNIIPAARISPIAKNLMNFWPAPRRINGDPLSGVNFIGSGNVKLDDDQRFVRVNHSFSDKDKIFGRYAFDDISYSTLPGDNPNFSYFVAGRNQNVAGQWLHLFRPT